MMKLFERKPGRPVTINKEKITERCLEFYWTNGIDNNSFNEVIKYAGVSKGSIYRIYGSEDVLQKSVLSKYFETVVNKRIKIHSKDSIKKYVMAITSSLITNKSKPCLFYRTKTEKYKLGPVTRKFLGKMEGDVKKSYINMIKKDFKLNNKKISEVDVIEMADYLINSMSTLTLIKLNTNSHKSVLNFSKYLVKQFSKL